jgi:lipoate-protein ligase A
MQTHVTHKTPGGKLVRLQIDCSDYAVTQVRITGDFFVHPEESLSDVEAALRNFSRDMPIEKLVQKINQALAIRSAEMVGIDALTLAKLIHEAANQEELGDDLDY